MSLSWKIAVKMFVTTHSDVMLSTVIENKRVEAITDLPR